jgi:hypothetical protein
MLELLDSGRHLQAGDTEAEKASSPVVPGTAMRGKRKGPKRP